MPRQRNTALVVFSAFIIAITSAVYILSPSGYVTEKPGPTYDVLGTFDGKRSDNQGSKTPLIEVLNSANSAENTSESGKILLLTVSVVGGPGSYSNSLEKTIALFDNDQTVVPQEAFYKPGTTSDQVHEETAKQMTDSQNDAVTAAQNYLVSVGNDFDLHDTKIAVDSVGGPSAGLSFTLGILQKTGLNLTRNRIIAATGTIDADGKVGAIGGVQQKMVSALAAGAQILLVPEDNYTSLHDVPNNIKVYPIKTLGDAISALQKDGV